ncbi:MULTISPECIES: phage virion morphogenesis protein [unclassified Pseudomonas]|uniref:phage virion morphogenesis protein n=1 Tax=unclassified Pseudomonas TaxID=196821 RepID=UPI0012FDFD56|nr:MULTISPECIES: phage virion morphogenesis protein [unclassified Pseudomonas]MCU1740036.1 phage virion morphogenesis protein [Pseudomonas sp. 20S_6.2_Bac1]
MPTPMLDFDIRGLLDARAQLQLLDLPATKRRRVLNTASKRLRTQDRKRIRDQRNLDGTPYARRKSGGNRKMLRGLGKGLQVVGLNAQQAVLGWKSRRVSRVANEHQQGRSQTMAAARLRRWNKTPQYQDHATRPQARALLKAGYRVRQDKRWKRPTQAWVMENLKTGQAGLILSRLLGDPKKQSWKIDLPARIVLGANAQDVRDILQIVLAQTLNAPR